MKVILIIFRADRGLGLRGEHRNATVEAIDLARLEFCGKDHTLTPVEVQIALLLLRLGWDFSAILKDAGR